MRRYLPHAEENQRSPREILVGRACSLLCKRGLIRSHYLTERNGGQDRNGIDVMLFKNDGTQLALQVTRSIEDTSRRYKRHPRIPCIIIQAYQLAEEIADSIADMFDLSGVTH